MVDLFCKELQFFLKQKGGKTVKNNFSIILATQHKKIADIHNATGISKYTLTQLYYQRVKNPQTETVTKIADYLGCSLDELLARVPYVVEV